MGKVMRVDNIVFMPEYLFYVGYSEGKIVFITMTLEEMAELTANFNFDQHDKIMGAA